MYFILPKWAHRKKKTLSSFEKENPFCIWVKKNRFLFYLARDPHDFACDIIDTYKNGENEPVKNLKNNFHQYLVKKV